MKSSHFCLHQRAAFIEINGNCVSKDLYVGASPSDKSGGKEILKPSGSLDFHIPQKYEVAKS